MIRDKLENIKNNIEVRKNISELRKTIKEQGGKHALLYALGMDQDMFVPFLKHEDSKVRKNTALLLGDLARQEDLEPLFEAYMREEQRFVRSAYLTALKEFDYRDYIEPLKKRLEELSREEVTVETKKHIQEEMRGISDLIVMMEGVRSHKFVGMEEPSNLILLTNRNHIDVTKKQLECFKTKAFGAGLMVKCDDLARILEVRTFEELLFMVDGMNTCEKEIEKAAKTIASSDLLHFLTIRHKGKAPFYFRIELKAKMDLDKKSAFTKKLAAEIEQRTNRQLINTTSNYEVELRLIENKEGNFNVLVKLYTLKDSRFNYRKEVLATSIKGVNAALTIALAKDYLKEGAQVLDPFCGVGTMLIERHKLVKANTMYGLDTFSEAIEKAKGNTQAARQIIHYVNRDFFDFTHEYLFDEVITNMPRVTNRKSQDEIFEIYQKFFKKVKQHLAEDGVIIMYSHNREWALQEAKVSGFRLQETFEINKREGSYVLIFKEK